MISIIVPSRNRPDELKASLDSMELPKHGLEALVWLDKDDPTLSRYQQLFKDNPNVRLYVKERVGYIKFYIMLNFLSSQAKNNWIFEWNDDVIMTNPDWFQIFTNFVSQFDPTKEPVVINAWGQGEIIYNLFPIVSRAYLDILGHFALTPNCDDWVRIVSIGAKINHNLKGFKPKHRKYGGENPLRDETFHEVERDRREWKKVWNEKKKILPKELDIDIKKIIQYKKENKIS